MEGAVRATCRATCACCELPLACGADAPALGFRVLGLGLKGLRVLVLGFQGLATKAYWVLVALWYPCAFLLVPGSLIK